MSLTRTNLRTQIKEILLARILNGEYKVGDRLVELQIAQEFGTSCCSNVWTPEVERKEEKLYVPPG